MLCALLYPGYKKQVINERKVSPRKLEHSFRILGAGIPETLPCGHEDNDAPTFWMPLYIYAHAYIYIYVYVYIYDPGSADPPLLPAQWFPPPPWCGVVVGCFPPPCGVVWFGCGLWWFPPFPPCGVVWVGWFPPACLDLLGVFGKPMLMMILMMMMTIIMIIINNHLSVSLVGRVSSAHVPADDYGFIDRGATIFVTVVALGQMH